MSQARSQLVDAEPGRRIGSADLLAAPGKRAPTDGLIGPARTSIDVAISAARHGDVDGLRQWFAGNPDVDAYDTDGWTPLLAAAVRGQAAAVEYLLKGGAANPDVSHRVSGALAIHFAGHAGSVDVAKLLLDAKPNQLDAVWNLNGHTLLLQAAFYATPAHEVLARFALERGASTTVTTVRGLAPMEMALQFNNQSMADIIRPYDAQGQMRALDGQIATATTQLAEAPTDAARAERQADLDRLQAHATELRPAAEQKANDKRAYTEALLQRLARAPVPAAEQTIQSLSDRVIATIESGLRAVAQDASTIEASVASLRELIARPEFQVNRLGGRLQQPPMVVAVTGGNANPSVANLRHRIVELLVAAGGDPMQQEVHPMAVDAFIRAMVFNHLDDLRAMAASPTITPERLAEALNRAPVANGLTGFHDTILRAGRAPEAQIPQFLEQIRWCRANGARVDIEDFSGRTQEALARAIPDPVRRNLVLEAMGLAQELIAPPSADETSRIAP